MKSVIIPRIKLHLLFTFLCICTVSFGQEIRTVQGQVIYDKTPLVNVQIKVNATGKAVTTNLEGKYSIKAEPGDILEYAYPGMRTMEIVVEDVTRFLNVTLSSVVNELDEVVVTKTVRKTQKQLRQEYHLNKNLIHTMFGIIDRENVSYRMKIIEGKDLPLGGIDFLTPLQFRFPGMRVERSSSGVRAFLRGAAGVGFQSAIFDLDGMVFTEAPLFLMVENIERVAIITGLNATAKYGSAGNGGVIAINTKNAVFGRQDSQIPFDLARINTNMYKSDAINRNDLTRDVPSYLFQMNTAQTLSEAKSLYKNEAKSYTNSIYFVLDTYDHFANHRNDLEFADTIIQENRVLLSENPIALKALAYFYQAEGRYVEANELYKEIFILRPNYVQSYLDMANSYREIGEYQKAAGMYARYGYLLEQGFLRKAGEASIIIERDLNNLVALKGRELLDRRDLKKLVLDDEFKGTRLVFEWNDSEAEFELQFVNPEDNYFKSERSLFADAERIKKEKIAGISSEEYLIDESLLGVWQVNARYLGNKRLTPTYLKATVYHNYGSAAQRKETKVFKLDIRNVNRQLFMVSNFVSVVSN